MTFAYGLPSGSRPYPARHGCAARRSRPKNILGLASLATGGVAVLAGILPLDPLASAALTLASVALGFAALGRAHRAGAHRAGPRRPGTRHTGTPRAKTGWPGLVLELTVGALVLWASIVLLTALAQAGDPGSGPATASPASSAAPPCSACGTAPVS
nr:hypothetical protein GCM10020093_085940 [Planobispora longispora]